MIHNPILPGFHPDPSIIRVEDDFYLVTSTFEWFPGIPLYHSKDLKHWQLVDHLLKTPKQADLLGVEQSRGVWAPGLSYDEQEGRFYLTYSVVHSRNNWLFDVDNYLMWTDDIRGEWSDPVYVNSSGFDPFIFHDDDGSKWILNKDRDFRPWNMDKRSIVLQQFDPAEKKLVGPVTSISQGATQRRFVEGAHMFKRDGWYYLLTAEGGTGYGHCAAIARSRNIRGPYEPSPYNPVVTSAAEEFAESESTPFLMPERYNPDMYLQKAGHASFVTTPAGEWYMVHLCGRPLMPQKRCILGRETAIQKIEWTDDGWPRLAGGGHLAQEWVEPPEGLDEHPFPAENTFTAFDGERLPLAFCVPRVPITADWAYIDMENHVLKLRGRESLTSFFNTSLIARRLMSFRATVTAKLHFQPDCYQQMAGITCYYDAKNHFCAYKTYDESRGSAMVSVYSFHQNQMVDMKDCAEVPMDGPVWLRACIDHARLQFYYSLDGESYAPLGDEMDMSLLSDETCMPGCFTGSFVGMFAQDIYTRQAWATYEYFHYKQHDDEAAEPIL